MRGKNVVLALLGAILLVFGLLVWMGMTGGSQHIPGSKPGVGFVKDEPDTGDPAANGRTSGGLDAGPITKTVIDRAVRDELRKRILAGWAQQTADPDLAAVAKSGKIPAAPTGPDGGAMDPKYIQEVVRSDFFPMAGKCYEELLARNDAAAGRVEMSFTIVADEKLGGIVEDVGVASDGGVADEKMTTCMRESMTSLAFRPPAHGGYVTVVYPITFSPTDHDE